MAAIKTTPRTSSPASRKSRKQPSRKLFLTIPIIAYGIDGGQVAWSNVSGGNMSMGNYSANSHNSSMRFTDPNRAEYQTPHGSWTGNIGAKGTDVTGMNSNAFSLPVRMTGNVNETLNNSDSSARGTTLTHRDSSSLTQENASGISYSLTGVRNSSQGINVGSSTGTGLKLDHTTGTGNTTRVQKTDAVGAAAQRSGLGTVQTGGGLNFNSGRGGQGGGQGAAASGGDSGGGAGGFAGLLSRFPVSINAQTNSQNQYGQSRKASQGTSTGKGEEQSDKYSLASGTTNGDNLEFNYGAGSSVSSGATATSSARTAAARTQTVDLAKDASAKESESRDKVAGTGVAVDNTQELVRAMLSAGMSPGQILKAMQTPEGRAAAINMALNSGAQGDLNQQLTNGMRQPESPTQIAAQGQDEVNAAAAQGNGKVSAGKGGYFGAVPLGGLTPGQMPQEGVDLWNKLNKNFAEKVEKINEGMDNQSKNLNANAAATVAASAMLQSQIKNEGLAGALSDKFFGNKDPMNAMIPGPHLITKQNPEEIQANLRRMAQDPSDPVGRTLVNYVAHNPGDSAAVNNLADHYYKKNIQPDIMNFKK